jgi:hypothetical protein
MGFEDKAEQSLGRPCCQSNGRTKRTYELTSSIVPRGTSFHCWVDLGFPPIALILCAPHAATVSLVQRNSVPSTQMRCMITANRRASATIAFFIPRCLSSKSCRDRVALRPGDALSRGRVRRHTVRYLLSSESARGSKIFSASTAVGEKSHRVAGTVWRGGRPVEPDGRVLRALLFEAVLPQQKVWPCFLPFAAWLKVAWIPRVP